jgi:predicted DsbA family dithiol-disulfide isomerase
VAPSHREGRLSTLVLYHDFVSPFSRLALLVARDVARETGLALRLVPLELFPPPVPLPPAPETLGAELEAALPLARALGAELALPARVPRTRKAHEALVHARRQGEGMGQGKGMRQGQGQGESLELDLAEALYDAVWRRGQDIGRLDVLAGLGAEVGLDRGLLHVALGLDTGQQEILAAGVAAAAAGIDGVPTFRLGDDVAVGLFPAAELLEWIRSRQ